MADGGNSGPIIIKTLKTLLKLMISLQNMAKNWHVSFCVFYFIRLKVNQILVEIIKSYIGKLFKGYGKSCNLFCLIM
jgi:hypothetical protein